MYHSAFRTTICETTHELMRYIFCSMFVVWMNWCRNNNIRVFGCTRWQKGSPDTFAEEEALHSITCTQTLAKVAGMALVKQLWARGLRGATWRRGFVTPDTQKHTQTPQLVSNLSNYSKKSYNVGLWERSSKVFFF